MIAPHDVKAQPIRLLDVVLIGPLMVYGGARLAEREALAGNALAILGLLTVVYNGANWVRVERSSR